AAIAEIEFGVRHGPVWGVVAADQPGTEHAGVEVDGGGAVGDRHKRCQGGVAGRNRRHGCRSRRRPGGSTGARPGGSTGARPGGIAGAMHISMVRGGDPGDLVVSRPPASTGPRPDDYRWCSPRNLPGGRPTTVVKPRRKGAWSP